MVRVASLKDMVHANYTKRDIAGMTAQEQLDAIDGKRMSWSRISTGPTTGCSCRS